MTIENLKLGIFVGAVTSIVVAAVDVILSSVMGRPSSDSKPTQNLGLQSLR